MAETVVCISRPHLNQCSNVNVWYRLGLSSILFAQVRQHFDCIAVPPWLTQAGLCRCPPHRATGELSLPWCRKLAQALLLHRPGCVWLLVWVLLYYPKRMGVPLNISRSLPLHCTVGIAAGSSWTICYLCKPQFSYLLNGHNDPHFAALSR